MKKQLKNIAENIKSALFPLNFTCDLCGRETFDGTNLCPDCKVRVQENFGVTCPVCGRRTVRPEICYECKAQAPRFDRAVSPLVYEDGAAILVAKFKQGSGYLKEYFCDLLAKSAQMLPDFDFITYIPMTEKAQFKRGYNQAKLLAEGVAERLGKPLEEDVLIKIKETSEQKSLSRRERAENLEGCFFVHRRKICQGKNILLIDDVLTTGATADAACKLLRGAGAVKIYFAAAASVEYKLFHEK